MRSLLSKVTELGYNVTEKQFCRNQFPGSSSQISKQLFQETQVNSSFVIMISLKHKQKLNKTDIMSVGDFNFDFCKYFFAKRSLSFSNQESPFITFSKGILVSTKKQNCNWYSLNLLIILKFCNGYGSFYSRKMIELLLIYETCFHNERVR